MNSEMNYETKYWELREECERALDKWFANPQREDSHQKYLVALTTYQDFCMDVLEILMDKNMDVLKNL